MVVIEKGKSEADQYRHFAARFKGRVENDASKIAKRFICIMMRFAPERRL